MKKNNLAKRLKELRVLRGMSQEYLAETARVSLRTVQRIENNESVPTGETIKRISVALDVEMNTLVDTNSENETSDLRATIIFLNKQRSKTNIKSEIKIFEKFIDILNNLKEKDLSSAQLDGIESYIRYLELEKIPSFGNELFKQKMIKLKTYLKKILRFVPYNHYTILICSFAIPFVIEFGITGGISDTIKITTISAALSLIGIGIIMDFRIKRQNRSFSF